MLDLICYLVACILAALAALAPTGGAALDRVRLLAAAFAAFAVPFVIEAGQHV